LMTPEQRGAYIDLLCHQWNDETCSLPDDDNALSVLSGLGEGWFKGGSTTLRLCFPKHPSFGSRIANEKLLKLREEREEWIKKSKKGGRKSAAVRGLGKVKGGSRVVQPPYQPKGNSSSSSSIIDNTNVLSCGETSDASSTPPKKNNEPLADIEPFACDGNTRSWRLTQPKLESWQSLYPSLDCLAECRKARQWLDDNPARRKTAQGMPRFLGSWLARAQNSFRGNAAPSQPQPASEPIKYRS
jgi:hypothetical protein